MQSIEDELKTIPQRTQDYQFQMKLLYEAVLFTNAKKVIETGTDVGDSTRIIATALRKTEGVLVTLDSRQLDLGWLKDYPNVKPVTISSKDAPAPTETIDFLYLDSDHHYDNVVMELNKFGSLVRVGGVIMLHDTCHSEFGNDVTKAIREFCRKHTLRWGEDPQMHGMAWIEISHELVKQ